MDPSTFFFSYQDPSPGEFAFRIVDPSNRFVWSPAAKAFVSPTAAPPPADTLIPCVRVGGPGLANTRIGAAANLPDPPDGGQWLVYAHPAGDGDPVAGFVLVQATPRRTAAVAVVVRG